MSIGLSMRFTILYSFVINFLDITIYGFENILTYGIYRKPTTTNIMIHKTSCHPIQHNMSGINYLSNRLNTYPLEEKGKSIEKT
jgi:hypothetical protein